MNQVSLAECSKYKCYLYQTSTSFCNTTIHSRLADICGHPINLCLEKQVAGVVREVHNIPHDHSVNRQHHEYKQTWQEYWERFKRETTVAWLLLPTTRSDLFAIEAALIEQHKPRLNGPRQAVFLNTSSNALLDLSDSHPFLSMHITG